MRAWTKRGPSSKSASETGAEPRPLQVSSAGMNQAVRCVRSSQPLPRRNHTRATRSVPGRSSAIAPSTGAVASSSIVQRSQTQLVSGPSPSTRRPTTVGCDVGGNATRSLMRAEAPGTPGPTIATRRLVPSAFSKGTSTVVPTTPNPAIVRSLSSGAGSRATTDPLVSSSGPDQRHRRE